MKQTDWSIWFAGGVWLLIWWYLVWGFGEQKEIDTPISDALKEKVIYVIWNGMVQSMGRVEFSRRYPLYLKEEREFLSDKYINIYNSTKIISSKRIANLKATSDNYASLEKDWIPIENSTLYWKGRSYFCRMNKFHCPLPWMYH